jgi:CTP:molybdopterin cytidylyltransferase MocA
MSLREEILAVPKGGTLNDVVRRHKAERRCVEVLDPGVIEDLDTPEDLARWRQSP